MSEKLSNLETYKQDPRVPCKYGDNCYQKNPIHLSTYKHPLKSLNKHKRKYNLKLKPSKKLKRNVTTEGPNEQLSDSTESNSEEECVENYKKDKEVISSSDSEESDQVAEKQELESAVKTRTKEEKNENETEIKSQNTTEADLKDFNSKLFIKSRFLVEPPSDFYQFWYFCKGLKPTAPNEALKEFGLELVGPYDVLAGKFKHVKELPPEDYLRHWRYYYDLPEVLTIIKGEDTTGFHIGYFYDSPDEPPCFLVSNHGTKDGTFTKMGDNIFCAINLYLEELKATSNPFKKICIGKFSSLVKKKAEELKLNLSAHSQSMKQREFKVVAKTFNKIGLVVPYNRKTQLGYRDLAMNDKDLLALLNKLDKAVPEQKSKILSDLQPVLTYANIALDECDFGTGVKLGWELLYHGTDCLNSTVSQFLGNSYRLLQKEAFAKIAEAHMAERKKGCNLSII